MQDSIRIDEDLLVNSGRSLETLVSVGMQLGVSTRTLAWIFLPLNWFDHLVWFKFPLVSCIIALYITNDISSVLFIRWMSFTHSLWRAFFFCNSLLLFLSAKSPAFLYEKGQSWLKLCLCFSDFFESLMLNSMSGSTPRH